jgi:branched-chain amino acid transport system substrate-binding protein
MALLTAACVGGDDDADPESSTDPIQIVPTTTTTPDRAKDGRLTIGLLLPTSGRGRALGDELRQAATAAIDEANAAGGVREEQIVPVSANEGESSTTASRAVQSLLDQNVDAIIGPASSLTALSTLDRLLSAGVLTCSPTATALALDEYPNRNLFFRTAPSDSLQAVGLANLTAGTGRRTAAVTWVDDVYGRPLATAVTDNLEPRPSVEVVARVPFTAASDLDDVVDDLLRPNPGVVIVVADGNLGTQMLTALADATSGNTGLDLPEIVVNDAMRSLSPSYEQRVAALPDDFRAHIQGLAPAATGSEDLPGGYTTNAYDCATLIALAAQQVGPDDTVAMEAALPELTTAGNVCRTFEQCKASLDRSLNIDYDGPANLVQIGARGDPDRAWFETFTYDEEGRDVTSAQVQVNR